MPRNKKRTKQEASPGSLGDQPDKIHKMSDLSPSASTVTPSGTTTAAYANAPVGGPFMPPHLQYLHQLTPTHYPYMMTAPSTPQTGSPTPASPQSNNDVFSTIINKLNNIEKSQSVMQNKLLKLDEIEVNVNKISGKVSLVEAKVASLESKFLESEKRLLEIENSRNFDCDISVEMKTSIDDLACSVASLRRENHDLSENLLDLQARSMRENLLFFNFDEETSYELRKTENCVEKILDFCEQKLGLDNAKNTIRLDRAHRLGSFEHGKKRPIVTKFNFYGDKMKVKDAARERLRDTAFRVSDQFPKQIQDRRKKLIPYLVQAKRNGQRASLSHDALYIDGVRYTHDRPPPGPVPELPPRGRRVNGSQRGESAGSSHGQGRPRDA